MSQRVTWTTDSSEEGRTNMTRSERNIECPVCGAQPGERCTTPSFTMPGVSHKARRDAIEQMNLPDAPFEMVGYRRQGPTRPDPKTG